MRGGGSGISARPAPASAPLLLHAPPCLLLRPRRRFLHALGILCQGTSTLRRTPALPRRQQLLAQRSPPLARRLQLPHVQARLLRARAAQPRCQQ